MTLVSLDLSPSSKTLQQFGYIALFFFGGFGIYSYAYGQNWGAFFICLGLLCGLMSLIAPSTLKPIYVGLMIATFPIGFVVSHIILAVLYYGILTPTGLIMRGLGYDPMKRQLEPEAASYWIPKVQRTNIISYFKQY